MGYPEDKELWHLCYQIAKRKNPTFPFAHEYQFLQARFPALSADEYIAGNHSKTVVCLICYQVAIQEELNGHALFHLKERGLLTII